MRDSPWQPEQKSWFTIACQAALGIMGLAMAVANVTTFWDLTERHDKGLLVVAQAAVGGFVLGVALTEIKRRIAGRS